MPPSRLCVIEWPQQIILVDRLVLTLAQGHISISFTRLYVTLLLAESAMDRHRSGG